MAVSRRLRYEVLRRDGHTCRYCGGKAPDVMLTVDHVVPVALGGSDEPENLVAACVACNAGKTSTNPDAPLVANVADDALRWAAAMQKAAALAASQRAAVHKAIENFDDVWVSYFSDEHAQWDYHRDSGWRDSIARFLEAGLDIHTLAALAESVLQRNRIKNSGIWRYFCGAAWNELSQRQETARALIDGGEVD